MRRDLQGLEIELASELQVAEHDVAERRERQDRGIVRIGRHRLAHHGDGYLVMMGWDGAEGAPAELLSPDAADALGDELKRHAALARA